MKDKKFWSKGIQFECQGSGKCCVSHGGYGYVWLTKDDRRALAKKLGLNVSVFTRQFCDQKNGIWKLKDGPTADCVFLKNRRCSVYSARPTQCRTWPFWPEILNAKTWSQEVASFCPGVGQGKTWSAKQVETQMAIQKKSEEQYGS